MKKYYQFIIISFILLMPFHVRALSKEETVYSKLESDGSVKSIVVSEHLINKEKSDIIEDITDLENIKNVNSDKKFNVFDKRVTWESRGSDIFYQGTIHKELPINESVTYYLDGKEIKLDDLLGKKGHVEISIKYQNTSKEVIHINGSDQILYTPFVVTTVTNINGENNYNINITNGRVVDNGVGYLVVGIAAPGLYDSLGLNELRNLDNVLISFDTDNFELSSIYSIATPKLLGNDDLSLFDKVQKMYNGVEKLQSSMNQIQQGSQVILNNLETVSNGSLEIAKNLELVLDNLEKIKDGTVSLDNGLKMIVNKLEESQNEFLEVDAKIEQMNMLISKNNSTIDKLKEVKQNYEYLASLPMLPEEYQTQFTSLKAIYDNMNLGSDSESMISLLEGNNYALNLSIQAFSKVKDTMEGLNVYLPELKKGADELSRGTESLTNGVAILNEKMNELSSGTVKLKEGMITLNSGINTFNSDGISTISNMANNVEGLSNRVKNLVQLSHKYQSFSLTNNDITSSTKFVMVVDGKKLKNSKQIKKETTNEENIWNRFKNLFQ